MEKIEILPQVIFKFQSSNSLLNDTYQKVLNLSWRNNELNQVSVDSYLHKSPELTELYEWFNECILKVKREVGFLCDELKITQSWANRTDQSQAHHPHVHPNSIVSGIYYLNPSSSTVFEIPSIWRTYHYSETVDSLFQPGQAMNLFLPEDFETVLHRIEAVPGTLVLFPSTLKHGVEDNPYEDSRYTISFNTFPCGDIGNFRSLSGLRIEVL